MDDLDRRILVKLQRDGNLTNARLAQELGLSQSAMSERVRRLEQEGHIAGYRALINPASLGLGLQAFVAADDPVARQQVLDLAASMGFRPLAVGPQRDWFWPGAVFCLAVGWASAVAALGSPRHVCVACVSACVWRHGHRRDCRALRLSIKKQENRAARTMRAAFPFEDEGEKRV